MLTASHRNALVPSALAAALLLGAGCGGHGSTDSQGGSTSFRILTVSVPNNGTWQINRPIEFSFNQDVDFSSVNLNTINITQPTGIPATGEFSLKNARTVVFQPACPTQADFSDAGLLPGGITYLVNVLGSSQGGPTVRSTNGRPLTASQTVQFATPMSAQNDPTILFLDPQLGPPNAIVRTDSSTLAASFVEIGGDATVAGRRYFEPRAVPDPELGADAPAGFKAPLNLYSVPTTSVAIVLALNQPVDPSAANVKPENIDLQYQKVTGNDWSSANVESIPHTVELVSNCSGTGAQIRLVPTGILPQGHRVRVVLGSTFHDLVGDFNIVPIVVGTFDIDVATNPGTTTPGAGADKITEEFTTPGTSPDSLEDTTSVLTIQTGMGTTSAPRAVWGSDGKLAASFAFDGTGGAQGKFDWIIDGTVTLDTQFSVITDDTISPGDTQTLTQTIVNGRVDVRSLWVKSTGTLIIQGPNPCTILCSGNVPAPGLPASVLVEGVIKCSGANSRGVVSFGTAFIPEQGAAGQAGGGDGGTGSFLTTQSTPFGGPGSGAFNVPAGGGIGGESGFTTAQDIFRRPGGGGGGRFGPNQKERNPARDCPDQRLVGMDAENGFKGAPQATGALPPSHMPPNGGTAGPSPFVDMASNNDFWGTMITSAGEVIRGELPTPWAGQGGGGGGDACLTNSFPTTPFTQSADKKGAGGGGGGGSLTILALGDIRVGGASLAVKRARIEVNGGAGGGGENSNNLNRIGGGSGGGSGGHLILQTGSQIDLTNLTSASTTINGARIWGGLFAKGGQGGAGADNVGGASTLGETTPDLDALPENSYPSGTATTPCRVTNAAGGDYATPVATGLTAPLPTTITNPPQFLITNTIGDATVPTTNNTKVGAGGDGGPGIIQLHAPTLTDILVPLQAGQQINFRDICFPLPVGATPANANAPAQWNQMLPIFGRRSVARSKWIPLGLASVDPVSVTPDQIQFLFGGTDTTNVDLNKRGVVLRGLNNTTLELPAILSGIVTTSSGEPFITADLRTVVFDAGALADDIYKRNPAIVKGFVLKMTTALSSTVTRFDVASATYDSATDQLRVTVANSGTPLAGFALGDTAELIPRFFRVSTEGALDSYPTSTEIKIKFQAAPANALGQPDATRIFPSPTTFATDIATLNAGPSPTEAYRFIRFQVEFDILADGGSLTATTPIPAVEFLTIPFRF